MPAFRVFNDRTLRAMSREHPTTEEDFRRVPGVGDTTFARFGTAFLDALRQHAGEATRAPAETVDGTESAGAMRPTNDAETDPDGE